MSDEKKTEAAKPSKAQAFLIRCQARGILTAKVFLRPPTDAEMREELGTALAQHGHDRDGKPRDRFVSFVPVEVAGGADLPWHEHAAVPPRVSGKLTPEESKKILALPKDPPAVAKAEQGQIEMVGEGRVTNPGEPGHEEHLAAIKAANEAAGSAK